jgi:CTP-dependent riboflavin kinase
MRIFEGKVVDGWQLATPNLNPVMELIKVRTGLTKLWPGTLNLQLSEDYIVKADAVIKPEEYPSNRIHGTNETIKFQRCLAGAYKALIMRPDTHEAGGGHGTNHFEIMSSVRLRDALKLTNGDVLKVQVEGDDVWWNSGI